MGFLSNPLVAIIAQILYVITCMMIYSFLVFSPTAHKFISTYDKHAIKLEH